MRVLCLSGETIFLGHVATVFADSITKLDSVTDPDQFLAAANNRSADVFLIDYDQLRLKYPDPVEFIRKMPPQSRTLVIGSFTFADWHQKLQEAGAVILHKPTAIVEIGLVLRRLIAEGTPKDRS